MILVRNWSKLSHCDSEKLAHTQTPVRARKRAQIHTHTQKQNTQTIGCVIRLQCNQLARASLVEK